MDKYEHVAVVGEGSYGIVMKCRHKETGQIVAIKKFLETEEDATVRKMALREIRMLKKLKHENLVTMIEVFRHKKRFYLVFEYLNGTLLDEMEKVGGALNEDTCRQRIFQVIRAVHFCHTNNVIHRDIKPENILVSMRGVVKLCDFGFARLVSINGERCTEYVATRWYRSPELLVGEHTYGAAVDIWAIGCLYAEMMTGDPLFPGDSDIDQLYLIIKLLGNPCARHQQLMMRNTQLRNMIKPSFNNPDILYKTFSTWNTSSVDFLTCCLQMNPSERENTDELMNHALFVQDNFSQRYLPLLRKEVLQELEENPLLNRLKCGIISSTDQADAKTVRMKKSVGIASPNWQININKTRTPQSSRISPGSNSLSMIKHTMSELLEDKNSLYAIIKEKVHQEVCKMNASNSQKEVLKPVTPVGVLLESAIPEIKTPPTSTIHLDNILHPTVNNICFCSNPLPKNVFKYVPVINTPKVYKEHNAGLKIPSGFVPCGTNNVGLSRFSNVGVTSQQRNSKNKTEELVLPSIPGAILTPHQTKKKSKFSPNEISTHRVAPDANYKKVKRKYAFLDNI